MNKFILPIQAILGILAFRYILTIIPWTDVTVAWNQLTIVPIIGFILFIVAGFFLAGYRWSLTLRLLDIHVSARRATLANGFAFFYGLFLPGQATGEIMKTLHLGVPASESRRIAASVIIDKISGLIPLVLLAAIGSWLVPGIPSIIRWATITATIVAFIGIVIAYRGALPNRWKNSALGSAWNNIRHKEHFNKNLAQIAGISIVLQFVTITGLAILAVGAGASNALPVILAYSVASFATMLPVTFLGIGVREGVFVWVFRQAGLAGGVAIILSEAVLLATVTYGMSVWIIGMSKRIQEQIKRLWTSGIGWAIAFSLLLLVPQTIFMLQPGYQGIYLSNSSDEEHYVSAFHEVADGHILHANTYLFEYRDAAPNIFQWIEVVVGFIYRLLPIRVDLFVWLIRFISITCSFFLLYRLFEKWRPAYSPSWRAGVIASWFVLPAFLAPDIFTRIADAMRFMGPWSEMLPGFRFMNPVVSVLILFIGLTLHWRWQAEPKRKWAILLGLILAAANYLYIFFWMFLAVYIGLWLLVYLYRKDTARARSLALAMGIGLLLSVPFWIFIRQEMMSFTLQTPLALSSHLPIIEKSVLTAIAIFFGWLAIRRWYFKETMREADWALSILAATALLAVNQQVITGRSLQPHHFYWLTNLPIASLLLCTVVADIGSKCSSKIKMSIGIVFFLAMYWLGLGVQMASTTSVTEAFRDLQHLSPAFVEIRAHPDQEVIYADDRISELVPMYTNAYVSYAQHATAYLTTPQERRRWAWFVASYLNGLRDPEKVRETFQAQREKIGTTVFEAQYYRELCGSYSCFPDSVLDELINEYQNFLKQPFADSWFRYKLDAILWDEQRDPSWNLNEYSFLQKTWQGDNVSIWKRR